VDANAIKSLTVVGLGRSGIAAALLAARRLDAVVTAVDDGDPAGLGELDELRAAGIEPLLGAAACLPDGVDLVVKSPGVPTENHLVKEALRRGLPLWSEVELAFRFLDNPVIGITGTNGKTTTTELTGAMVRAADLPCAVAGNVGLALARLPGEVAPDAIVVVELSSFQLEHIERFRADVGVLLNLTEDHLDRHGAFGEYTAAKLRIFENQDERCVAVLFADDPVVRAAPVPGAGRRAWFGLSPAGHEVPPADPGSFGTAGPYAPAPALLAGLDGDLLWLDASLPGAARSRRGGMGSGGLADAAGVPVGRRAAASVQRRPGVARLPLCTVGELALKGDHNVANSLAAAAAAAAAGVPLDAIAATLREFPGVRHRLQVVGEVDGVLYVNDSKATNVDAALKALTAYHGPVLMILGGSLKGGAFHALAEGAAGRIKQALLIGQAAPLLEKAFARRAAATPSAAAPYVVLRDLEAALRYAAATAHAGDVVLLSPACASFDQYRNYEQRGEHFIELVARLKRGGLGGS
jgi:UDP-N-acetylmuramoylalanine--D-glutamate ligase